MKKGDVGMAKCFSKSMETRDELSTTCAKGDLLDMQGGNSWGGGGG